MRCGVLHNGKFGRPDDQFDHIMFSCPVVGQGRIGEFILKNSIINGVKYDAVLSLDAVIFCEKMITASEKWAGEHKNDGNVLVNLPTLIHSRPSGVAPFIEGVHIVA
jgi:hypothetical protein